MSQPIYNIQMVDGGVQLVLQALNQLPHGQVRGLIDEIAGQYQAQKMAAGRPDPGPTPAPAPAPDPGPAPDSEGGEA
jgi:hypothetical protein